MRGVAAPEAAAACCMHNRKVTSRSPIAAGALAAGLSLTAGSPAGAADALPDGAVKTSNERTITRFVNPSTRGPIRRAPHPDSRVVASIRIQTEDNLPNVYLVLRRWTDEESGASWLQVRIPKRPNGQVGWVREETMGPLQTVRTRLVINRRTLRATLYRRGRRVFRVPVGIGAPGTPTPRGRFWIRERLVLRGRGGLYGPFAFGTSAYSSLSDWPRGGVVGIHGTNQPSLVPGRPSHGCIRMKNRHILRLKRLMPIGTPVRIR